MLPQTFMWLPIGLALLAASVILFWLVSRPGFPPKPLAAPPANAGDAISPPHEAQNHSAIEILSPVFSAEVQSWRSDILRWSNIYNLDPDLIATVMQIESCGHPSVLSSAGAIGLFQVMPFHFQAGEDPFDPETNARRGLGYLARGLELSSGQSDLALAGYNGGHSVIGLDFSRWSSETQRYVTWGTGILDDIASGSSQSSSLHAWMQAGGASLCRRANLAIASLAAPSTP